MSSPYLKDWIENSKYRLPSLVANLKKGNYDRKEIHLLCEAFRQWGACHFLHFGSTDLFFIKLNQSAGAHLHFLKNVDDSQKVTSKAEPFYDAVGCGIFDCAREIAKNSRMTWHPSYEYEDDFLFTLFIMKYFFLNADKKECQEIIDAHKTIAGKNDKELRGLCTACLTDDTVLFEKSLCEFLEKRSDHIERKIEREALSEERWAWDRYISIEGLALIKLAELKGFKISKGYLHVHDRLRESPSFAFNGDAWRGIDFSPE